jgi:hypothetical protein
MPTTYIATQAASKYPRLNEQEILEKYGPWLWKMDKMKYTKSLVMCSPCIQFNRNVTPEIVNGRVRTTTSLCPNCAKVNIDFSTSWYFNTQQPYLEQEYIDDDDDDDEEEEEEEEKEEEE